MTEFTLKNVKYSAFASKETHCFEATLYRDGKRFCIVGNDGNGGPDYYAPLNKHEAPSALAREIERINIELGKILIVTDIKNPDGTNWKMHNNLQVVVGTLLNEYLLRREVKKLLKRITFVKPDHAPQECFQFAAKIKPTAANLYLAKQSKHWRPEYILLNELSLDDAIAEFSANRAQNGSEEA